MLLTRIAKKAYVAIRRGNRERKRQRDIKAYTDGGKKPWSRGYELCKFDFIRSVLSNDNLMERFRTSQPLPEGYGSRYDERVVEYPWTLSRLSAEKGRLLDAGSCFNFQGIIDSERISEKDCTILTFAPEHTAFWERGISYHYGDLRALPFRDDWFDEICSISTLEHIGMDNRMYTGTRASAEGINLEAGQAVKELVRVLKPGGRLLVSVPFGKAERIEWDGTPFAEQFDSQLLNALIKMLSSCTSVSTSFYKYTERGWNVSTEQGCRGLEYFNVHTTPSFDPDYAAAARAVALIEAVK